MQRPSPGARPGSDALKTHILWDHDGVLVDTEPLYYEATRHAIAAFGIELEPAGYLREMAEGRSAWEHAQRRGIAEPAIRRQRAHRDELYQRLLQERQIEIPGVEAVLEELSRDHAMAIVTTARREDFELIHRHRRIVGYMDFVLTSGDYPRAKPAPDPYLAALRRFAIDAGDAVVVEDSERGLRAAVAAGIDCVVVANDFVRGHDFSTARARIASLADLPALLPTL